LLARTEARRCAASRWGWDALQACELGGLDPAMAGDDLVIISDQHRLVKPNFRMLLVICRMCFSAMVRALLAYSSAMDSTKIRSLSAARLSSLLIRKNVPSDSERVPVNSRLGSKDSRL